jgi:transcriptional regulator with XRE-family HTH domain/tetratricopeptide (TPR) repeat protein
MPSFDHELLLRVRLDLGLTQEQAASAIGVDVRTYRRYESGAVNEGGDFQVRHAARRRLLRKMCEEFGVANEADWLKGPAVATPKGVRDEGAATNTPPQDEGAATNTPPQDEGAATNAPPRDAAAKNAPPWRPCYVHPLQRAPHFVGRAGPLASLEAFRSGASPTPRVVAIVGVGGSGKTALVERFLREGAAPAGEGGTFVWSFYEDRRIETLLARALAYFANEPAGGEGGRLERLVEALGAGPRHLVVFDGLEVVQSEGGNGRALGEIDDMSLRRLVRAFAAGLGEARLLLTSRLRPADLEPWEGSEVQTIVPGELTPGESKSLLRAWGLGGDEPALEALAEGVGGHALSVAVLGSYGSAFLGGDSRRAGALVLDEASRDDARARRLAGLLEAYARSLEPLERDALARLSVFGNGVGLDRLTELGAAGGPIAGALAGASESAIARALGRLERLGLVYRSGSAPAHYTAHPFVREFFKAFLDAPPERVHEALRSTLAARLEGRPGGRVAEPGTLDALEALFHHTIEAGRADEAWTIYERGLGGFSNLGLRLGAMARGARLLRRFARDGAPERLRPGIGPGLGATIAYDWGLYAGALGDLELACRCYEAQRGLVESADAGPARADVLAMNRRTLAYTHWLRGDLGRAAELLDASLAAGREADSLFHLSRGYSLLAAVEHDRGRPGRALACLERARTYDPTPVARRAFWEAELRLALGQALACEALARGGLAFCEQRGWPGHVAHGRALLGESALALGDEGSALASLERARAWALESGEVEMMLRSRQLAARIALARGDAAGARREARFGLDLADFYGFRPFAVRFRVLATEADLRSGALGHAEARAREALALADACDYAWGRADALHALGAASAALGHREQAREALGDALALREELGHPREHETREALARLGGR